MRDVRYHSDIILQKNMDQDCCIVIPGSEVRPIPPMNVSEGSSRRVVLVTPIGKQGVIQRTVSKYFSADVIVSVGIIFLTAGHS